MKTESTALTPSSYSFMEEAITSNVINSLSILRQSKAAPQSDSRRERQIAEVMKRLPSTEEMEPFFSQLRGVNLILATLSYGLKVTVSELQGLRIRDVNLATHHVVLNGVARPLPSLVIDDVREYLNERVCGSEASVTVSKREQRLFSEHDLRGFFEYVTDYQRVLIADKGPDQTLTEGCFNRIFRVLGRFHARGAAKRGTKLRSPLDLFDKGPKIVRRGRWGVVDAYYLWRTVYPLCR
jgi:hypothetical protein